MAIIEKLTNEQVERENSGYLQIFKKKGTNKLMYLTKDGVEKVIIDQDLLDAELATLPTPPTTTVVNITPTQTTYNDGRPSVASGILAMGSTPIELLPTPGVGKYYDGYGFIEYYAGDTNYTYSGLGAPILAIGNIDGYFFPCDIIDLSQILSDGMSVALLYGFTLNGTTFNGGSPTSSFLNLKKAIPLSVDINIFTMDEDGMFNLADGNGIFRITIYSTIKTLEA